jgi:hypothetical protein
MHCTVAQDLAWVLKCLTGALRVAEQARLDLEQQHAAAARVQAAWRGYKSRKKTKALAARKAHLALTSKKIELGMSEQVGM